VWEYTRGRRPRQGRRRPAESPVSARAIERKTRLDFIPELPAAEQDRIETERVEMW